MRPDSTPKSEDARSTQPPGSSLGNGRPGFRYPSFDDNAYIFILLIVIIPIIFTIILCTITYCVYRRNRKRSEQMATNSPIMPIDRSGASVPTIIYNPQHSPFIFEELPPPYDSLAEKKKDPHMTTTNTNEQFQLTIPSSTSERVTAAIVPTAPTPSYINLDEAHK